jgi:FkbM family methyltransferase
MNARIDAALRKAAEYAAAGRLDQTTAALADVLREEGDAHAVLFQLGMVEAMRGNLAEAEHLVRAAVLSAGDVYAGGLGRILAKAGRLDEAKEWLHRALAFDAKDVSVHASLAAVYGDLGQRDEALGCLDAALAIQPDLAWAQASRERLLAERRFFAEVKAAFANFTRTLGLDPESAATQRELEIPSAATDAAGNPRFVMVIPAPLIMSDLGAAHLFHGEVLGQGYEFGLRTFLDRHLRSDDVFIDVGAHWGLHSLTAATRWPRQVSVLAIEAHPENARRIKEWVQRNRMEDAVEVIAKAISDREGVAHLRVNGSSMGHSLGAEGIEVGATTLDRLLSERPWLRWRRMTLKIDVEGYEREVLAGATKLFSTCEVAAVIWEKGEFHGAAEQQARVAAIFEFLDGRGFNHYSFENEGVGGDLLPLRERTRVCNVYSLRPVL